MKAVANEDTLLFADTNVFVFVFAPRICCGDKKIIVFFKHFVSPKNMFPRFLAQANTSDWFAMVFTGMLSLYAYSRSL